MKRWFARQIGDNPFLKSVAVLMGGSIAAQLLPVLLSSVLSRIFHEQDFGVYALFVATINIAAQMICLKYDMAIVVADDDESAISIVYLCILISAVFSLLLCAVFPFADEIARTFGTEQKAWIYFLPLSAFLTGLYNTVIHFNLRLSHFKDISQGNIIKSTAMVGSQILFFMLGFGGISLVIGQVLSYFFGNLRLMKNIMPYLSRPQKKKLKQSFLDYKNFPLYTMAGSLANTMVYNLTSYALAYFYSSEQLGYYSLINRVLAVPLLMISTSVGQVFLQEAGHNIQSGEDLSVFHSVTKVLFLLSLPIFLCLYLFGEPLITIVFGQQWAPAAVYLKIMLPLFMVRFVVTPVSTTAIVAGKQRYTMLWQFGLLIVSIVPMICTFLFHTGIEFYLMLLSVGLTIGYILFYLLCNRIIKDRGHRCG